MLRPMSDAPKENRTRILALTRPDLDAERADLKRWCSQWVVIHHPGVAHDGFDIGWSMSAPVGHGGFPDEWFVGWTSLPTEDQ